MQMPDMFDKIKEYLEFQKVLSGDSLFLDQIDRKVLKVNEGLTDLNKDAKEPDLFTEEPEWKKSRTLDELDERINTCEACALAQGRTKFVFGKGSPNADIMVIGEGPGRNEDMQGEPFVGRAGQLLTKILAAINLSREEVFIGNIVKCRPPENRKPMTDEINKCEPYLLKQIELIKPAFLLALGATAVDSLLKKKHKMADVRGQVLDYHGIPMMVTYHPAFLLRSPGYKRQVWEDVQILRKLYDEYLESKK